MARDNVTGAAGGFGPTWLYLSVNSYTSIGSLHVGSDKQYLDGRVSAAGGGQAAAAPAARWWHHRAAEAFGSHLCSTPNRIARHLHEDLTMPDGSGTRDGARVMLEERNHTTSTVEVHLIRALARLMRQAREEAQPTPIDTAEDLADEQEECLSVSRGLGSQGQ